MLRFLFRVKNRRPAKMISSSVTRTDFVELIYAAVHRSNRVIQRTQLFGSFSSTGRLRMVDVDAPRLSGMFLLTAFSHWRKRRPDLIRMVPQVFPRPDLRLSFTDVLEVLGAVGHMVPFLAPVLRWDCLMLLAVFPANVHAACERLTISRHQVPRLLPRTLEVGVSNAGGSDSPYVII
jgi:uncharacterized membrane protein